MQPLPDLASGKSSFVFLAKIVYKRYNTNLGSLFLIFLDEINRQSGNTIFLSDKGGKCCIAPSVKSTDLGMN